MIVDNCTAMKGCIRTGFILVVVSRNVLPFTFLFSYTNFKFFVTVYYLNELVVQCTNTDCLVTVSNTFWQTKRKPDYRLCFFDRIPI